MSPADRSIPVALSARHAHLSQQHVEVLFGPGYTLTPRSDLSQPGQFAAEETIEVVGPKRSIPKVRVLGPARALSQVELAFTDGIVLGINLPVRLSGDVAGTPGAHLIGPRGAVKLTEGCIVAMRHIHATPQDAERLGVEDGQIVYVRFPGPRGLVFDEVIVRVSPDFATELHLDTDEGNAAGIRSGDRAEVVASICRDLCGLEACPIAPDMRDGLSEPYCAFAQTELSFFRD
ncbi:MAG: phosphate propanoyltransferase [Deltaproteobacteria bacterium]|nr:phosphate propanoyltransferase [Deltaproteobacteria bacterium]